MSRIERIREFLGLRRSIVGMLVMIILVGMGERIGERFLPVYLYALGAAAVTVGLLNGVQNLLGALYSFPGGYLADRIGTKASLLVFNATASVGFLIVIYVQTWWAVIVGAFFFLCWSAVSLPATMKLVAKALPTHKRTMGVTMHSLLRRVPMALGPILGGYLIDMYGVVFGMRLAFMFALAITAVATLMQQVLIHDDAPHPDAAKKAEANPFTVAREMSPDLRRLLIADILIRFCEQIPYAFVVIWCTATLGKDIAGQAISELDFGILTAVEMATAMLIYLPVAYFADRTHKKPFVVATFCFFTAFPVALLFSRSFWPLVFAFVLRGLKEFGEPTRKALIMDLAPDDRKAAMFGLYYLVRDSIVSLAAFGGGLLWAISPTTGPVINLVTAFAFGVAGTVWFALYGRDLSGAKDAATPSAS